MVFSSPIFLFVFLPFTLFGYFIIPNKFRSLYLLLFSLGFFATTGKKALLLFVIFIGLNYCFGLAIDYSKKNKKQWFSQLVMVIAITVDIATLLYFKYSNFFVTTLNQVAGVNIDFRSSMGLLGISFFTFSALSYLLDINSGKISANRNILDFSLYMSFFPKLLQGPIARFGNIIPQVKERVTTVTDVSAGIQRFIQGLAKKVIIADELGVVVDQIFAAPANQTTIAVSWLGAIGYALQIYFDFSGYTDMAIGIGKMLGFNLPENFNYPYISTSVSDFWRRWHITLSSWFRDYLFIPLEFKRRRVKILRSETNILIVFLLTGLWHGASWNFVIWGLWHGLFISLEVLFRSLRIKWKLPYAVRLTSSLLVILVGWVLFRSSDLTYAAQYLSVMFGFKQFEAVAGVMGSILTAKFIFIFIIGILLCLPWKLWAQHFDVGFVMKPHYLVRAIGFTLLLIYSIIMVLSSSYQPFIYFQC